MTEAKPELSAQTWVDPFGLEWFLEIKMKHLREFRKLGLDNLEAVVGETCQDPGMLCEVLMILGADQARKNNVDEEKMLRLLKGQGQVDAWQALLGAVADFFPPERMRALLKSISVAMPMIGMDPEMLGRLGLSSQE